MMSKQSLGVIASFEDPSIFFEVQNLLEKISGLKIIYITQTTNNRLYIIDEERLRKSKEILRGGNDR